MYNKIILVGRLTADPELKYTPGGIPVTKFTLAVKRAFKNQQDEYETDFIDHQAWRNLAEVVFNNVKKGYMVATDGRLQLRSYDDKEGIRRKAVEVICENIRFLDRGKDGGQQAHSTPRTNDGFSEAPFTEDDLPF